MVDHVEFDGAVIAENIEGNLEVELRLIVVTLERALNAELRDVILGDSLAIGLNLACVLRELSGGRCDAIDSHGLEDSVASTIRVNAGEFKTFLILGNSDLQTVVSSEVRDGDLKLGHNHLDDLIDLLVDDEIADGVSWSLLKVDHDNFTSTELAAHWHLAGRLDTHTGAHAKHEVRHGSDHEALVQDG